MTLHYARSFTACMLVTLLAAGCKVSNSDYQLRNNDATEAGPSSSNEAKGGDEARPENELSPVSDDIVVSDVPYLDLNMCGDDSCSARTDVPSNLFAGGPERTDDPFGPQNGFALDSITKGVSVKGTVFHQIGASVDVDAVAKVKVGASFKGTALLTGDIKLKRKGTLDDLPAYITESTVKKGDNLAVTVGFGVEGQFQVDTEGGVSIVVAKATIKGSSGASVGIVFSAGYEREVTEEEDGKTVVDLLTKDLQKLQVAVQRAAEKWFEDHAQTLKDALAAQVETVKASKASAADAGRVHGGKVYYDLRSLITLTWKGCYKYSNGWGASGEAQTACWNTAKSDAPSAPNSFYDACMARVTELCRS